MHESTKRKAQAEGGCEEGGGRGGGVDSHMVTEVVFLFALFL